VVNPTLLKVFSTALRFSVWSRSTLRELEAFPGTGLAGLFALFLAGITGEEIVLAKRKLEIRIGLEKCA